jgi:hypothetical protein
MDIQVTIPQQIIPQQNVTRSIKTVVLHIDTKTADVIYDGGLVGEIDVSDIIAAATTPQKTVIKGFLKAIIAKANGIQVSDITNDINY